MHLKEDPVPASLIQSLENRCFYSTSVLTWHNDLARDGQDRIETTLTPGNVNASTFGKVASLPVDGQIYAQPLYYSNVKMADGKRHNVVYVATEHDDVYAFDTDTGTQLWHRSFIDPKNGITTVPASATQTEDIFPEVGITGTPVIDPATGTMYLVSKQANSSGKTTTYHQYLRSISVRTGNDVGVGSKEIVASVAGAGEGYTGPDDSMVPFDALKENQRPGLLLNNGVLYIGWASHGDTDPYHGWLISYNATNLRQITALNLSPDGLRAPVWMGAAAPSVDAAGNIYVATGNGTFSAAVGGRDYANSVLRISQTGGRMKIADYFTPSNQATLNQNDKDVGSSGVTLLPNNLAVTSNKAGDVYLLNTQNLGGFSNTTNNNLQTVGTGLNGKADFSTAAYFHGAIYYAGAGQSLVRVPLSGNRLATTPSGASTDAYDFPGTTVSISSHGNSDGIVWAIQRVTPASDTGDDGPMGNAVLHAYDATTMKELYSSDAAANNRDQAPAAIKFSVPTVADGKVMIGTANALVIYGLRPSVSSFSLVNASNGAVLKTLTSGTRVSLSSLPKNVAVVANVGDATAVASASLQYDQQAAETRSKTPYTLTLPSNTFTIGKHTIAATLFSTSKLPAADDMESIAITVVA